MHFSGLCRHLALSLSWIFLFSAAPSLALKEFAALETVRLARIETPNKEIWTMAIVGSQLLFKDREPGAFAGFPFQFSDSGFHTQVNRPFAEFAAHLRAQAIRWDMAWYKKRYPQIDPKIFDELLLKDPALDEDSALIVLFRGEDANDIIATFRVAKPNQVDEMLPLDRIHGRITAPPDFSWGKLFELNFRNGNILQTTAGTAFGTEFKNLVKEPGLAPEVTSFLIYSAERFGLTAPYVRYKSEVQNGILRGRGGFPHSHWLICDASMKTFYERFGFETFKESVNGSTDIVMTIKREKFIRKLHENWNTEGAKMARGASLGYRVDFDFYNALYSEAYVGAYSPAEALKIGIRNPALRRFKLALDEKSCEYQFKNPIPGIAPQF